jgi:hypothetical protein
MSIRLDALASKSKLAIALARIIQCAVKLCFISGSLSRPATIVLAGSNRSGSGGNKTARAFDGKGRFWRLRESVGRNVSER